MALVRPFPEGKEAISKERFASFFERFDKLERLKLDNLT